MHPVVRVHPDTGRRGLFVNPTFTTRVLGISRAESDALLRLLYEVATAPEHTYRHRWSTGDVVAWDNRATPTSACGTTATPTACSIASPSRATGPTDPR